MAKKRKAADVPFAPPAWPGLATMWKLDAVHPYPQNARTHPQAQITILADLLKKYGPDQPIVVDEDGVIIKGHGRRTAALEAGLEEFPVVQRLGLSVADKRAMRIADNQVSLLSGWDQNLIRTELQAIQLDGYDVTTLGFPEVSLRGWGLLAAGTEPQQDPDAAAPEIKKSCIHGGDIWEMGNHRMLCGDCTQRGNWDALFWKRSPKASMVFTDPPYGVSYEAQSGEFGVIQGDKKRRDDLYKMLHQSIASMAAHAMDTAAFYIWHASSTREDFAQAIKRVGLEEKQYLIWVKPTIVFGRADYQWQHEPCFYACKAGNTPKFYGERAESTVWHVRLAKGSDTAAAIGGGLLLLNGDGGQMFIQSKAPKGKKLRQIRLTADSQVFLSGNELKTTSVWQVDRDTDYQHPTQKPVELARRAIENSTKPGEIVIDGFLGSGTCLLGAEMTGRRCFGMELDPIYAEGIVRRWEKFTGQKATMDGKTLEQLAKSRR